MSVKCYKIMELAADGKSYRTLFHGVNGNRTMPFDTWIKAERKWGGEGGAKYWTGFHVILDQEKCERYLKRFYQPNKIRVIVKCVAKNLRPKESSRGIVFLADELMIPSKISVWLTYDKQNKQ